MQKGSGRKLGETLVDEGITTEENIAKALSSQLGYEMVDLQDVSIDEEILKLVPPNILKKHKMIPFEYSRSGMNVLRVAMSDPMNMAAMDDINIITNLQVEPVVATSRDIMLALDQYYGQAEVNSALEEYVKEKTSQMVEQEDIYNDDINNSPDRTAGENDDRAGCAPEGIRYSYRADGEAGPGALPYRWRAV